VRRDELSSFWGLLYLFFLDEEKRPPNLDVLGLLEVVMLAGVLEEEATAPGYDGGV
jgi:hypothetical protein